MIGFINVYKPSGMTSNAVVQKVKKRYKIKKIGHMGTLDPLASGVLPIAIGKATRLFDYSLNKTKRYTAVFDFGYTTDTLDTTGTIEHDGAYVPNREEIESVLPKMLGENAQIPPMYSAKNVNGMRAYDLARRGIEFELKPKNIIIHKLELIEQVSDCQYKFDIVCSSGTYIRAIGRDIANLLDTYATMSMLERTETGSFNLDNAVYLDKLLEDNTNLQDCIISPIDAFGNFDIIEIDSETFKALLDGKKVEHSIISNDTFVVYDGQIVGVAKKNIGQLSIDTFLYETKE